MKKGRGKRQKITDQTENEGLYLKEEDSGHDIVPQVSQKKNRRTQKSIAAKEIKADYDDPSVGDEANEDTSNLRKGRKKSAPSNIENKDGDNDPENRQEAYKSGKASKKAAVVTKTKVQVGGVMDGKLHSSAKDKKAKSKKPIRSKGISADMDDVESDIDSSASDAIAAAPKAKKAGKKGAKKVALRAT